MNIIRNKPILSGIVIFVVVIIAAYLLFGGSSTTVETLTIRRTDFTNEITVSGKAVAAQHADLGFDQSGRIATIYAKVGDAIKAGGVIASLDNGTSYADAVQKEAILEKERAKLAALQRGTRTEQLAITEQTYEDASSALIIAMRNAYTQTESAIVSKADSVFTDGITSNPSINIRTASFIEKQAIEKERVVIGGKLALWKQSLAQLQNTSTSDALRSVRTTGIDVQSSIKTFLDHLSGIAGALTPQNSGISQESIDTHRSTISAANEQADTAAASEQTAYGTWTSAINSLALDKSGSTSEDIAAQAAQVKSAEADVASAKATLRKTSIVAPFDGIITKMDLKIGEVASPTVSHISIMSSGSFEIESYIPEVNIARVQVGDQATATLDAYGPDAVFNAIVISVDPAETLKDGVSTYKARLRFVENDSRIRSGMTANIRITTEQKSDVIRIPTSIITKKDGKKFVQITDGKTTRSVEITTGGEAGFGNIEVLTGLSEGDVVVLPPISTN